MGNIYACGAIQTWVPDLTIDPDQFEPDPPTAAPGLYKVSNNMTVKLYGGVVSTVDGKTGSETNANVIYTGGIYPSTNLEVKNAANLTVEDGQLRPSGGDINNADVIVADGAELSLVNLGDSITTNDFTGGGSVVLGETQAWTINGAVSGTTQVGVGSIFNNASQTLP